MKWSILYTREAKTDLRNIYCYISNELMESDTASKQANKIMKKIRTLEEMPYRHRIYEDEPLKSKGIRFMPVDNFLIFYLPDESSQNIYIVRIMYGGRDIKTQFK